MVARTARMYFLQKINNIGNENDIGEAEKL